MKVEEEPELDTASALYYVLFKDPHHGWVLASTYAKPAPFAEAVIEMLTLHRYLPTAEFKIQIVKDPIKP